MVCPRPESCDTRRSLMSVPPNLCCGRDRTEEHTLTWHYQRREQIESQAYSQRELKAHVCTQVTVSPWMGNLSPRQNPDLHSIPLSSRARDERWQLLSCLTLWRGFESWVSIEAKTVRSHFTEASVTFVLLSWLFCYYFLMRVYRTDFYHR